MVTENDYKTNDNKDEQQEYDRECQEKQDQKFILGQDISTTSPVMVTTFEEEEEEIEQQKQFLEQQDLQRHQQNDEQQQDEQQVKNNRKDGNRLSWSISNNAKSKEEKIKKDSFLPSLGSANSEKTFFYEKVPNEKKNNSINRSTLKEKGGRSSIVVDSKAIEQGINTWSINKRKKTFRSDHMMKRDLNFLESVNVWSKRQLIEYGFWTIIALVIQQVVGGRVGSWAFPDGKPACNTYIDMNGDDDEVLKNRSICELYETVDDSKGVFIVLAAFILGGFLASSVKTWLARRYAYTAICSSTNNLLINICSIVVHNDHEKKLLCRWACLGFELSVLDSRGLIDTEEAREYLDNLSLIKLDEWERMINGHRHTTIYFWIQDKVAKSAKAGHISAIEFQTLCTAITHSRDKANDLMGPTSKNQPPPYIFVCASLINIHLFLTSMATGLKWAIWMYDSEDGEGLGLAVWKEPRMSFAVIVLYLYTSMYAMLFDVCTMLYNPFGPRKIDVEHFRAGGGVRALAKGLSGNEVCPETSDFDYICEEEEEEISMNDEEKVDRLNKQRNDDLKLATFVRTGPRQPLGLSSFRNTRKARHDQKRKP